MADERIEHVTVWEKGGYAGVDQVVADIDSAALDPAARQHVEQAIASAGFFGRSGIVGDAIGSDLIQYVVTVTTEGGKQHSVTFVASGSQEPQIVQDLKST